jgi:hypothetical protein
VRSLAEGAEVVAKQRVEGNMAKWTGLIERIDEEARKLRVRGIAPAGGRRDAEQRPLLVVEKRGAAVAPAAFGLSRR